MSTCCFLVLLPQFGDGFNLDGAFSRCERENSQGCEQWAAVVYPKCRPGFHNVGCCVCSPDWCVYPRRHALLRLLPRLACGAEDTCQRRLPLFARKALTRMVRRFNR